MWVILRIESKFSTVLVYELDGYRPMMEKWTRPANKRKPVLSQVPIFPGWMFIPYEIYKSLRISSHQGIKGVIRSGTQEPLKLKQEDMDQIELIEQRLAGVDNENSVDDENPVRAGERVYIGLFDRWGTVLEVGTDSHKVAIDDMLHTIQVRGLLITRSSI